MTRDPSEIQRAQPSAYKVKQLRAAVRRSLFDQGFTLRDGLIVPPDVTDKEGLRRLHARAVAHRIERSRDGLRRSEEAFVGRLASVANLDLDQLEPRLTEVRRGSEDERMFRWASLHWSIPVSSGYGRRLRFLVEDAASGKLIGLIGLGDPVYSLAARDRWVGWDATARSRRLLHVADAFVLGAVPPYSYLLGGKLVAMLATSNEVRSRWQEKYAGTQSLVREVTHDGALALVTTTSALGRSSIYNRLRDQSGPIFESVGFTRGSGEFHFSDGLHHEITQFAIEYCLPTAKDPKWGRGFRNRREVVKKALPALGFSDRLMYHGIKREMFVAPVAENTREFLSGSADDLIPVDRPLRDLAALWRERWFRPRLEREHRHLTFTPASWYLWPPRGSQS